MFQQIFGEYLVSSKCLSKEQLKAVYDKENQVRIRMGTIAVTERMMTEEQADEVNQLQATEDKRFGDIAIEKGYLTESQVELILSMQNNEYLLFVQTLIDMDLMTLQGFESILKVFQLEHGWDSLDIEALKSNDVDRIIPLFLPRELNDTDYEEVFGIAIRTIIRLINRDISLKTAIITNEFEVDCCAMQNLIGDEHHALIIAGNNNSILKIANKFAGEEFSEADNDALDAVSEFANCINGLYASLLSDRDISVDMLPPEYYCNKSVIKGSKICALPVVFDEEIVYLVYTNQSVVVE